MADMKYQDGGFWENKELKHFSADTSHYIMNTCFITHISEDAKSSSSDPEYQLFFLEDGFSDDTEHYPNSFPQSENTNHPTLQQKFETGRTNNNSVNTLPQNKIRRKNPLLSNLNNNNQRVSYLNLEYPPLPLQIPESSFHPISIPQSSPYSPYLSYNEDNTVYDQTVNPDGMNQSFSNMDSFHQQWNTQQCFPINNNQISETSFERNGLRQNLFPNDPRQRAQRNKIQYPDEDKFSGYKSEGEIDYNMKPRFKKYSHYNTPQGYQKRNQNFSTNILPNGNSLQFSARNQLQNFSNSEKNSNFHQINELNYPNERNFQQNGAFYSASNYKNNYRNYNNRSSRRPFRSRGGNNYWKNEATNSKGYKNNYHRGSFHNSGENWSHHNNNKHKIFYQNY